MGKQQKYIIAIGILLVGLVGYFIFFGGTLATVGETKITKKDAAYRDKIVLLNFPEEKRSLGLFQLIKSARNLEIMKKHGIQIQEAQIIAEEERINKNTKSPEDLQKIKDVFGKDIEAYRRVFILPNLVDHKIYYDLFLNDEKIQAESLAKAQEFINEARRNPNGFRAIALSKKIEVRRVTVSLKKGMLWEKNQLIPEPPRMPGIKMANKPVESEKFQKIQAEMAANNSEIQEAKQWHESVLQYMQENEITAAPLNREQEWLVVHFIKKKSSTEFELDVAFFNKLDFGHWLEAENSKIPIKVYDSSLLVPK